MLQKKAYCERNGRPVPQEVLDYLVYGPMQCTVTWCGDQVPVDLRGFGFDRCLRCAIRLGNVLIKAEQPRDRFYDVLEVEKVEEVEIPKHRFEFTPKQYGTSAPDTVVFGIGPDDGWGPPVDLSHPKYQLPPDVDES